MKKTFYYRFRRFNGWLLLNLVLSGMLVYGSFRCPGLIYWRQMQVLYGTAVFSWLAWGYKYLLRHPVVVMDDEGVTIDHCRRLLWSDIESAEEKFVGCGLGKYRVIVFHPREGLAYRYNFLQKHNGGFSAFSLPLYEVVTPEDAAEMTALVANKTKLNRLSG